MIASTSRNAATRAVATRMTARRVGGARVCKRFQSTGPTGQSAQSYAASHIAAGVAGGVITLLGGYTYYRTSGVATAVDSAKSLQSYYAQTKSVLAEKAPQNPSEVLNYLRSVARSYAGLIPGGASYVESSFDALDELRSTHGEELDRILSDAYNEVKALLKEAADKKGGDMETAGKLVEVLRRRGAELSKLSGKVGSDVFGKLEEKFPGLKDKIGVPFEEMKSLVEKSGPEAKKVLDDAKKEIQDLLSKGDNIPEALNRAREIVQEKSKKLKDIVWEGVEDAIKDKPELKKVLDENKDALLNGSIGLGGLSSLSAVVARVQDLAKGKIDESKVKEFSEFVKSKVQEGQEKGWEGLQSWAKNIPGGSEALKELSNVDLQALFDLSKDKSQDAKQLAEETYKDVLAVLKEKAEKAKKIAQETKKEGEEKSKGKGEEKPKEEGEAKTKKEGEEKAKK